MKKKARRAAKRAAAAIEAASSPRDAMPAQTSKKAKTKMYG